MTVTRRTLLRSPTFWAALTVLVVLLGIGAWAFQPWRLWTSRTVEEALPPAVSVPAAPNPTVPPPAPESMELASGAFVTQEHATTGVAKVVRLADGSRYLRLEGLSTSDGPDLHVWLTDQAAGGDWGKYEAGRYVKLGALKGNHGNQNYVIPPDAQLPGLTSAVIWCDRFNVAFGSAPLNLG